MRESKSESVARIVPADSGNITVYSKPVLHKIYQNEGINGKESNAVGEISYTLNNNPTVFSFGPES